MGQVLTAGPHEVLVVSGGCTQGSKTYTVGGWAWAWWVLSDHQKMSLEIMTLEPKCEDVETQQGVPITVTAAAQVKIMNTEKLLEIATEQFLGKPEHEIRNTILESLEGHLRAILATMTVEDVFKDREKFAQEVSILSTNHAVLTYVGEIRN